ncbi:MAG: PKD domain-containing protein [Patescibacteria group bacterium]
MFFAFSFAFYAPSVSHAAVNQLVFTTEPQTVAPGAISDVITVQTQDSSGVKQEMEETGDASFVSSSATGQFVNSSGEPARTVMNNHSANRNFYYQDSTVGSHTITVTVTARTSGTAWSASQTITVGEAVDNDNDDNDEEDDDANSETQNNRSGSGRPSAHQSPTPISGQVVLREPFRVSAGRARLASVHSPIIFQATPSEAVTVKRARYRWSFGDGGSAVGEKATHIYHFSGEYQVVLNMTGSDGETAVGRTTVSVIEPVVAITPIAAERVTVINRSAQEVNLGGWQIKQGEANFTFPADTIVAGDKETVIPRPYLGFSPIPNFPLILTFPDATVATTSHTSWPSSANTDQESFTRVSQSLNELSTKVVELNNFKPIKSQSFTPPPTPVLPTKIVESTSDISPAIATIPVPKPVNFFTRVRSWLAE